MGVAVLILGGSGNGKSASLRNVPEDKCLVINVADKPLPFKNHMESVSTDQYPEIIKQMKLTKKKIIVVDDAQYLMANEFMRRAGERGFDKFTEIGQKFWTLIQTVKELQKDVTVYFLAHIERDQDGNEKIKTIGKLLDEKITIEGMFTIVLKATVSDGIYTFSTQSNGHDTVKSPIGMFPSMLIDNDLWYVDKKIREYYEIGDFVTVAPEEDAAVAKDVEKKPRRGRSREKEEKPVEASSEEAETEDDWDGDERPRSADSSADATDSTGDDGSYRGEAETDGSGSAERSAEEDVGTRVSTRSRKRLRDDPERKAVIERNAEKIAYAGPEDVPEGVTDVPFDENVKMPELEPLPKRKSRKAKEDAIMPEPETPAEDNTNNEKPVSRRRRRN